MSTSSHQASLLNGKGEPFCAGDVETHPPGPNQVQIRVKAVAINPVDWKIQDYGIFVTKFPAVLGEDVAGTIEAVGIGGQQRFKKGDRVIAHPNFLVSFENQQGGFQELVNVPESNVCGIPEAMEFEQAVVMPLAVSTASAGLYQSKKQACLELPLPSHNPKQTGQTVLIWGGSSSVGSTAIQLARASGLTVVATCSKRNFEFVEKLGAKPFDYNSPSIVGDLVAELQKGQFVGAYDAISERETQMQTAQVVASFGGGIIASTLPPPEEIPATVNSQMHFALSIFQDENAHVGKGVWTDFLPEALKSGQIKAMPKAHVVGHGLDKIEEACQRQKKGVSAAKIVVTV